MNAVAETRGSGGHLLRECGVAFSMLLLSGQGRGRSLKCQDIIHLRLYALVHPHPAVMGEVFVTESLHSLSVIASKSWCL